MNRLRLVIIIGLLTPLSARAMAPLASTDVKTKCSKLLEGLEIPRSFSAYSRILEKIEAKDPIATEIANQVQHEIGPRWKPWFIRTDGLSIYGDVIRQESNISMLIGGFYSQNRRGLTLLFPKVIAGFVLTA